MGVQVAHTAVPHRQLGAAAAGAWAGAVWNQPYPWYPGESLLPSTDPHLGTRTSCTFAGCQICRLLSYFVISCRRVVALCMGS